MSKWDDSDKNKNILTSENIVLFQIWLLSIYLYSVKRNIETRSCLWSVVWYGFKVVGYLSTREFVIRRRGNVTVIFRGLVVLNWRLPTLRWCVIDVINRWATIKFAILLTALKTNHSISMILILFYRLNVLFEKCLYNVHLRFMLCI